ncbi:MAG: DEAD/DEAH box helicase [Candidatus Moduliflexus flocculans]|nr:DEAD/DEAH box helicase [Candidatus Moduliflexus flocculans]
MRFTELDLDPRLQRAIADRGYTDLTPVQERTLADHLTGRDVAVQSQTGTGKTAAFLITMFQRLLRHVQAARRRKALDHRPDPRAGRPDRGRGQAPRPATSACRSAASTAASATTARRPSCKAGVDIIVGTPGRLLDLDREEDGSTSRTSASWSSTRPTASSTWASCPTSAGSCASRCPRAEHRQTMLFSATLSGRPCSSRPGLPERARHSSRSRPSR